MSVLLLGAFAIGLGSAYFLRQDEPETVAIPGLLWPNPRTTEPFQLIDHDARPFGIEALRGGWTFMFFGYTACPDACPTALAVLHQTLDELAGTAGQTAPKTMPRVVFVSVDPERDTPDGLRGYVRFFDPRFLGVTGELAELERFTRQFGIAYFKVPLVEGSDAYQIEHSLSILLFAPDGRMVALFSAPHDAKEIANRFRQVQDFIERHS
jgi:protein SCO1/2